MVLEYCEVCNKYDLVNVYGLCLRCQIEKSIRLADLLVNV